MKKGFFPKLAAGNLRKNASVTLPYFITCLVTTAVYYNIKSLSLNPGIDEMFGADTLREMLSMGSGVAAVFAVIFLFYSNRFLIRRRTKEFGIFNILGMEKRHLARVLFWESLYLLIGSLAGGLLLGMALDKLLFLGIGRILGAEMVPIGFFISGKAVSSTVLLFCAIAFLVLLNAVLKIRVSDPIRLVQESKTGEKEPRANWFLAILGLVCIGVGYWISLSSENPTLAVVTFFIAVLLVIAGTYLLFTAGSIALLKMLRRSKRFYYKANHFISVSGLLYRMKQNAVGLASICVLSTMVLVTLSGTGSLLVGMEDALKQRHPYELVATMVEDETCTAEQLEKQMHEIEAELSISTAKEVGYHFLSFPADLQADSFKVNLAQDIVNPAILLCMPLSEYNQVMGTQLTLEPDELFVYTDRVTYDYPTVELLGKTYAVKKTLDAAPGNNFIAMNVLTGYYLILPDGEMEQIEPLQKQALEPYGFEKQYFFGCDLGVDEETQITAFEALEKRFIENEFSGQLESRAESRTSFNGLYGGFFFVGMFLGVLFLMATVLIIYYKQISEGWEDRERYSILRKVGMDQREGKRAIHSQILIVFFLPLVVSFIHVAAAFPIVVKLLAILNLTNQNLYLAATGVTCLVFAVFYLLVYAMTAKTYYKIVSK